MFALLCCSLAAAAAASAAAAAAAASDLSFSASALKALRPTASILTSDSLTPQTSGPSPPRRFLLLESVLALWSSCQVHFFVLYLAELPGLSF